MIAVLGGTGQQGRGIAQRLARAGHPLIVGSRDPGRAAVAIREWPAAPAGVSTAAYGDAIRAAGTIVLTVPFESVAALIDEHRQEFRQDAVVVDVTVPLRFAEGRVSLVPVAEGSASEHIRARLPESVRVAAAFKTLPAHLLNDIDRDLDCDEFVCGDSAEARAEAVRLVEAMPGLRAVDVGPLPRAGAIEHLTLLAVGINRRHKIRDARFRIVGL